MLSSAMRSLLPNMCSGSLLLPFLNRQLSFSAGAAAEYKVGFVGLGKMGAPMVKHLLDAGADVVVYDHNPVALGRAAEIGKRHPNGTIETRSSPADVAADPEIPVVITMLSSAKDAKECYLGRLGLFRVPGGPSASLFIDCTTVDRATTNQLASAAAMLQLGPKPAPVLKPLKDDGKPHIVDAPVTGGVKGAETRALTFMVGGGPTAIQAATPLLQHMGSHIIHCGGHGSGGAAKLCNTLVVAANMAAVSESLALAKRLGLDPKLMTEVLNHGAARCWASEVYNPVPGVLPDGNLPSNRGYKAGMTTTGVMEQLRMVLDAAERAKSPAPVGRIIKTLYEKIEQEGLADKDFSSIYRYVYGSGSDNTEWVEGQQLFSSQIP